MTQGQDDIRKHYGQTRIVERILAALAETGEPTDRLAPEKLFPFDQLHGREIVATREHVERLKLKDGMHVLDVGSGIGGPARYIAAHHQAKVTGLDLTPEFVTAARELTRRCGMEDRVSFEQGNALTMPFPDNTFDAALCLYVGMNIEDKAGVAREIFRVLKPGGRLVWSEVAQGEAGPPHFPLPWARDPSTSFVKSPETLRRVFGEAGFRIVDWVDESPKFTAEGAAGGPPPSSNQVVMGEDFLERRQNFRRSFMEGRLLSFLVEAEKP